MRQAYKRNDKRVIYRLRRSDMLMLHNNCLSCIKDAMVLSEMIDLTFVLSSSLFVFVFVYWGFHWEPLLALWHLRGPPLWIGCRQFDPCDCIHQKVALCTPHSPPPSQFDCLSPFDSTAASLPCCKMQGSNMLKLEKKHTNNKEIGNAINDCAKTTNKSEHERQNASKMNKPDDYR